MNKQKWIEAALSKGMDSLEIYSSLSASREVTWYKGQMDSFTTSSVLGTSLRGTYNGHMSDLALEEVRDEEMDKVLDTLIAQCRTISAESTDRLRDPLPVTPAESKYHFVKPSMELILSSLKSLEEKALAYSDKVVQVASLGWSEEHGRREITNSRGISLSDESAAQILMIEVVVSDGKETKGGYKVEVVEDLENFDQDAFIKEACEKSLEQLGAHSLSSRTSPVIIEKDAMTSLFGALTSLYSGDLIFKGISPLKDKLGQKIFSDKITITDDPADPRLLSPASFDDEGCPSRAKTLVENGVFKQMLHSTRSADRMGTESTGNGFKGRYSSPVDVRPYGCCINPGEQSLEELQAMMKDGLVITSFAGLHAGLNPFTTNFSLQCSGYEVKDGKKAGSATLITAAGNFLELMNKVEAVGSDLEFKYRTTACPSIYFSGIAISGE